MCRKYSRTHPPIEMMNDEALSALEGACLSLLLTDCLGKDSGDRAYLRLCRIRAVRFERE